jgi:hypothetical protein
VKPLRKCASFNFGYFVLDFLSRTKFLIPFVADCRYSSC